jgi:hypothetical protein
MYPYAEDGVDVTLIEWMLSLTPAQRLEVLQSCADEIEAIREYRERHQVSRDSSGTTETSG